MNGIKVAIDGPAGAGKSTAARMLAQRVGYIYIDTGAMYRALTLLALREKIDWNNEKALAQLIRKHNISQNGTTTYIDNENVSSEIRSDEVNRAVSIICNHNKVRVELVKLQRKSASDGAVVMEGRDIGTVVLPDAELKFFLVASQIERSHRRMKDIEELGGDSAFESVIKNIRIRDYLDSSRDLAPLKQAKDAIYIDNTYMSIDFELYILEQLVRYREKQHEGKTT